MDSDHCILLVEDSADDVKLLKRAMRKAAVSCPVHIVADGDKAIEYLDGAGAYADRHAFPLPTLVLLDLKLPRRSGFEVLEYLRAHAMLKKTIVVVLTGSSESRDIANAYTRGANSYLVKPENYSQMLSTMNVLKTYWLQLNKRPRP